MSAEKAESVKLVVENTPACSCSVLPTSPCDVHPFMVGMGTGMRRVAAHERRELSIEARDELYAAIEAADAARNRAAVEIRSRTLGRGDR